MRLACLAVLTWTLLMASQAWASTSHTGRPPYWTGMTHINPDGQSSSQTTDKSRPDTARSMASQTWITVFADEGVFPFTRARLIARRYTRQPVQWFDFRSTSTASGVSTAVLFTADQSGIIEPVVATDSNGTWIVTFSAPTSAGDQDIYIMRSSNDGVTWSTAQRISSVPSDSEDNALDADPHIIYEPLSATWVIGWQSAQTRDGAGTDIDIVIVTSVNRGVNFSAPAFVNAGYQSDSFDNDFLQIFSPQAGFVQIVYRGFNSSVGLKRFYSVRRNLVTLAPWSTEASFGPQNDAMEEMQEVGIAVDLSNNLIVISYTTPDSIKTSSSSNGGLTFTNGRVLAVDEATDPVVGTDARGVFVTVWTSAGIRSFIDTLFTSKPNRTVVAERELFYSISTGQNGTGLGNGWSTPRPLDARNYGQSGRTTRPRIFVDAPRRAWVVVYQSTKTNYQQTGSGGSSTVSGESSDMDVFVTAWDRIQRELCQERSLFIGAHCVEAVNDYIAAMPQNMSSFQTVRISGNFVVQNTTSTSVVIKGGRRVAFVGEIPGFDSIQQSVSCDSVPLFIVDDDNSAFRFNKSTISVTNSPILVFNRGGTPAANLEVSVDANANGYGICWPFMSLLRCPLGFRPPELMGEPTSLCVPCPAGSFCPDTYHSANASLVQPCTVGNYCGAGSWLQTPCKVMRYYLPAAPAMTGLPQCSTAGSPCLPGYRCPPAARVENHTQVVSIDTTSFSEVLVFPGERTVRFTMKNMRSYKRRLNIYSGSSTPPWLGVYQSGGTSNPDQGESYQVSAVLQSNVPGISVSDQLTSTVVYQVYDYSEDDTNEYTAPIVVSFTRQVTSVIFSPEDGIKKRIGLGEPGFNASVYVFNIGCSDSVTYFATIWDCGHPDAPPITSSLGNETTFPLDWGFVQTLGRNGTIPVSSADPAEIRISVDPSSSILNSTGLLAGRLPATGTSQSRFGRAGLFVARACVRVRFVMTTQGIPLVQNVPVEIELFENCPAGTFSSTGTSEEGTCNPCPAGTYTNETGTRACMACPESRPRSMGGARSLDECLTAPGAVRDVDGSTLDCLNLGEGVVCNSEGIPLTRIPLRPGFWRADNRSKRIMKCLNPQYCIGGTGKRPRSNNSTIGGRRLSDVTRRLQGSNSTGNDTNSEDDYSDEFTYCLEFHKGALCEGCVAGYVRRGNNPCSICDEEALRADRVRLSWTIIAVILIVVVAFMVVQRKLIYQMFSSASKTAQAVRRGSLHAFSSAARKSNLQAAQSPVVGDSSPSQGSPIPNAMQKGNMVEHSPQVELDRDRSSSSAPRVAPSIDLGPATLSSASTMSNRGSKTVGFDSDSPRGKDRPSSIARMSFRNREDSAMGSERGPRERSWTRSKMMNASMRMSQRFQVKERASYIYRLVTSVESNTTLRILLSLFQVCSGISTTFVELFPADFHQIVAVLNVVSASIFYNIDFACVLNSNHYVSLVLSMVVPFVAILLIILGHVIIERRLKKSKKLAEITEVRNASFSLFLLLLFLIYPNVSNTILSTFACRRFDDGSAFLRKDLTIDCHAPERSLWIGLAAVGTVVYVIGVPVIYMVALLRVRKYLLDPDPAAKDDAASVSFLVEPYRREVWWYEVFESCRKLIQTSLLVFFLDGSVLQTISMIVVSGAVIIIIYELKPYKLEAANRLASVAQWCILIIAFLGMLYKVDLVKLDSSFEYNKRAMLDVLVILALFVTPSLALYQQRRFVINFLKAQFKRMLARFLRFRARLCPERYDQAKPVNVNDLGDDGRGIIISSSKSMAELPLNG